MLLCGRPTLPHQRLSLMLSSSRPQSCSSAQERMRPATPPCTVGLGRWVGGWAGVGGLVGGWMVDGRAGGRVGG